MNVLVTGANGFIGAQICAALDAAGHRVLRAGRAPPEQPWPPDARWLACDFASDHTPALWAARLAEHEVQAVVNCAGILRETGRNSFAAIHTQAAIALFTAAAERGLRVVQVSAIGDASTAFIASKWAADDWLLKHAREAVVLRPSVVYSAHGSYGGTSLIRALAALPLALPGFAGGSGPKLQPIAVQDLARAVVRALEIPLAQPLLLEAVGPEVVAAEHFLAELRGWLGMRPAPALRLPRTLIRAGMAVGDLLGRGPMGSTLYTLLMRGNVGAPHAHARLTQALGFAPASVRSALSAAPAQVQDRWHVRLYQLQPLLTVALAGLWLASGVVGLTTPAKVSEVYMALVGLKAEFGQPLAAVASVVNLLLGVLLLAGWRKAAWLMLGQLAVYTAFFGLLAPVLWSHPLGGLLKNVALVPALLVWLAVDDSR